MKMEDKKKQDKSKAKREVTTWTRIPNLIHLVDLPGKVLYLILNPVTNHLLVREFWEDLNDNGKIIKIYQPKQDLPIKMVDKEIIHTPRSKDYKQLLEDIISFIKKYLEMPHEVDYLIIALWIFHTYAIEKFDVTPYLYFYGTRETGKSTACSTLYELAFFCMWLTSPTESTIFRSATFFEPAIIVDEVALWGEESQNAVTTLIKSRYKRGLTVPRCNLNKPGEDSIESYNVFGPLVLATTEEIPEIIESRCFTFLMQKNVNPGVEKRIDKKEAAELRNRLTCFRADIFNEPLPTVDTKARRRLREITEPLYQMLALIDGNRIKEFDDFVNLEELRKQTDDRSSFEAQLVYKIAGWYSLNNTNFLSSEKITNAMNEGKREHDYYSTTKVSMAVRKIGFERAQKKSKRGYTIEPKLLRKLAKQYGVELNQN